MSIMRVLLTVLFAVIYAATACTGTAHAETASAELLFVAGSDHAALLAQDTRFDPRLQLQSGMRFGIGMSGANGLESVIGVGVSHAVATSANPGFSYAGWTARSGWVTIGRMRPGRLTGGATRGLRFTAHALFAGFDATYLLSFFPVLEVAPAVRIPLVPGIEATIEVPLGWQFRREMVLTISDSLSWTGTPYLGLSLAVQVSVAPAQGL